MKVRGWGSSTQVDWLLSGDWGNNFEVPLSFVQSALADNGSVIAEQLGSKQG